MQDAAFRGDGDHGDDDDDDDDVDSGDEGSECGSCGSTACDVDDIMFSVTGAFVGLFDEDEDDADMRGVDAGQYSAMPPPSAPLACSPVSTPHCQCLSPQPDAAANLLDGGLLHEDAAGNLVVAPVDSEAETYADDLAIVLLTLRGSIAEEEAGARDTHDVCADAGAHCVTETLHAALPDDWQSALEDVHRGSDGQRHVDDGEARLAAPYSRVGWRGRRRL